MLLPSHQELPHLGTLFLFPFSSGMKSGGERKQHNGGPCECKPQESKDIWGALNFPAGKERGSPANFMWASEDIYILNLHIDSGTKVLIKLPNDLDLESEGLS